MKFLRNHKFDSYSRGQVQERLKELNNGAVANGTRRFPTSRGDQKQIRVWWVPSYVDEVEVPAIKVQEDEVPF